jgi:hypothetical protein
MSLIDVNNDESVSEEEFKCVQIAMEKAKLTSVANLKSPKDEFISKINDFFAKPDIKIRGDLLIYFEVLKKSKWLTAPDLKYNNSASRYMSIAMGRKQVGTLVHLTSRPLLLRMKGKLDLAQQIIGDKYPGFILQGQEQNSSLTGFGELIVDFQLIAKSEVVGQKMNPDALLQVLNLLYEHLVEKWMPKADLYGPAICSNAPPAA